MEDVDPMFRRECESGEGQRLRVLIETHADEMVRASDAGRPALEPLLDYLPLSLAAALRQDNLMRAFGHMARLEMRDRGLTEKSGPQTCRWPAIRETSDLEIFQRNSD